MKFNNWALLGAKVSHDYSFSISCPILVKLGKINFKHGPTSQKKFQREILKIEEATHKNFF